MARNTEDATRRALRPQDVMRSRLLYPLEREDLAWAAGFLDGEGCFHLGHATRRGREYRRPSLRVTQSSPTRDVQPLSLIRLQVALGGLGYIVPSAEKNPVLSKRPLWQYRLDGWGVVQAAVAMLWSWLGPEKRSQAKGVLRGYLEWTPRATAP